MDSTCSAKIILFVAWLSVPALLWISPTFFGLFSAFDGSSFLDRLGILWLGACFRRIASSDTLALRDPKRSDGVVWFTKILTDPFHDVTMYYKAPVWLLKGQWMDPMEHVQDSH